MQAITPITPLEAGGEMFMRLKTRSFTETTSMPRPLSEATEIFDDFEEEEESEFEEYSPKGSFESYDDRRRSQTTLSSYEELPTPRSAESRRNFDLRIRSVEGPRGPHLFRSSQVSSEFGFDYALQMSPLLPKETPLRVDTAFSQDTVTPVSHSRQQDFSIASVLADSQDERDRIIEKWTNDDVIDWMVSEDIEPIAINSFEAHDITGSVLLNLQFSDLKELGIESFGKRHRLWDAVARLKGEVTPPSPQPTPFEDISRPCTNKQSLSRTGNHEACETPVDGGITPITPGAGKKRRGRKMPKHLDVVTPQESISIVAIEQLLPKPHHCAKGERCAKWRKQQRQLQQLRDESALGRFPISPTNGGHIYVTGDPGNATTARNIVPNVRKQPAEELVPPQTAGLSVVASSDLFGPDQTPEFALRADALQQLERRDPLENVKQFLNLQHVNSPLPAEEPKVNVSPPRSKSTSPVERKRLDLFPESYVQQVYPSLQPPAQTPTPMPKLQELPKLSIPRPSTADPNLNPHPHSAIETCRSATASPGRVYRLGTPASEMDVPIPAIDLPFTSREASQSVPPGMQFREQQQRPRSASRPLPDWRRPSFALAAVKEGEILSPCSDDQSGCSRPSVSSRAGSSNSTNTSSTRPRDPFHHSPVAARDFGYGSECSHAGWMRKRKTRMLRHEWQDAHFRLKGTQLAMHASARLSAAELESINVDKYSVACSNVRNDNKLAAALKSLHIIEGKKSDKADPAPFAFQLVPTEERKALKAGGGKTHHFAVKSKDERIDWMRELMLAKALQQKRQGYEVEVNGVAA